MKIVKQSIEIVDIVDYKEILKKIEKIGRVCWKSENKITDDSYIKFINILLDKNHESVLEHANLTFHIITDRGVSHEWIRHRISSYTQESTRYIKYNDNIEIILPVEFYDVYDFELNGNKDVFWLKENNELYSQFILWKNSIIRTLDEYNQLAKLAKPQLARSILPHSIKTEFYTTMNLRSIRHFIKLRIHKSAHPQIRELANKMLDMLLENKLDLIFKDLKEEK